MRRAFLAKATAALAAVGLGSQATAQSAPAPASNSRTGGARVKVVYQLSEGNDQAVRALGNLRNHLAAAPDTRIVVVSMGFGIDFLLEDAHDARGTTFEGPVNTLSDMGVQFLVCRNTLTARRISETRLLGQAKLVQAGVFEIARLQFEEGYAYIKP